MNLVKLPVSDDIVSVPDGVVELLSQGMEEFLLDYFDVEALLALEGIKLFMSNAALVQHQGLLAILLHLPGVQLQIEEKGCN